ncbi:hypothetical protein GQ42DRAFT_135568, partial [Ramicandelaber brevisporus]
MTLLVEDPLLLELPVAKRAKLLLPADIDAWTTANELQSSDDSDDSDYSDEDELNEDAQVVTAGTKRPRQTTYACTVDGCGRTFTKPVRLQEHIDQHDSFRRHKCQYPDCDKAYFRRSHLRTHELCAHDESACDRHRCHHDNCNRGFATNQKLQRHIKAVHEGAGGYKCEVEGCGAAFRRKHQLNEHAAQEHGATGKQQQHVCSVEWCGKTLKSAAALRKHEEAHEKSKNYACMIDGCTVTTAKWSELQKHIKLSHRDVKQMHLCDICNRTFTRAYGLTRHQASAHGIGKNGEEASVKCEWPSCRRAFATRSGLQSHVKTVHLNDRSHLCPIATCSSGFPYESQLRRHIK